MAAVYLAMCLIAGSFLGFSTPDKGDVEVSCVFMESCILPCSFQGGTDVVIYWSQVTGDTPIHSYYQNQDQLTLQDQHFKGRTSVFQDQISGGNASLRLTRVEIQDQGRYKCYTSTISGQEESYINLKVDAPVRKVDMQQVENRITCSSEGIYPEPELTWSTSPPSNVTSKNTTTVQNQQQLYSISSSLILSDGDTDLVYSCTVSSGRNKRRATLFKQTPITGSDAETTISCTPSNTTRTSLVWWFNHSQIILNQTGSNYTVSEGWRQHVKGVSESGSLTLKDLSSSQEGIYTCELSNDEETNIQNTFLRMETRNSTSVEGITGLVGAFLVVGTLIVLCILKKGQQRNSRRQPNNNETGVEMELQPIQGVNGATPRENSDNLSTSPLRRGNEV